MGIVTGWEADDDAGQRVLLTHVLQREGYSVIWHCARHLAAHGRPP